ncbi:MAG TPA: hypothetical protein VHE30_00385 [Polyangiaceae bacterium]|nr:hypothetical protein [Polyangiaceae bacterium]
MTLLGLGRVLTLMAIGIGLATSCSQDERIGSDFRLTASPIDSGTAPVADASTRTDGATHACVPVRCQGHLYACGDCQDNDGDSLVDMEDPDCLGPCHNAEDTFFGSIPGQNHTTCTEDCYFDQDSGGGNDGCEWSRACDVLEVPPDYYPSGDRCAYDPKTRLSKGTTCATALSTQDPSCAEVCGPLTPNGCDCFGCCEIQGHTVWLGSTDPTGTPTCDLAHVADPTKCHPCTQVPACTNPCDECERCVGKPDLPPTCGDSACPVPVCLRGDPCGGCLPDCAPGQACVTGCCVSPPR